MENNEINQPKYRQATTVVSVYKTSLNSYGVNIPIKIVRNMNLKTGETIEINIKKIEG